MNTLIVVTGPTAVGKTAICIDIAKCLGIPVINADSRQIYKEMKIGTATPTEEQMDGVKHYFVGNLRLDDYYNAAMFEQDVLQLLDKLYEEQKNDSSCKRPDIALMSGGSMMYIDAVCNGIDNIPTITDETRQYMKERLANEGLERLCEELRVLDPEYYAIVDRKNTRRVVHGLEICHQTGTTYTSFRTQAKKQRPFRIVKIVLNRPREELYSRINNRVDQMVSDGLLDEARKLYPYRSQNALNTVGYKEMFEHIDGTYTLDEAIERIKGNTRRYARKQLTWFKRDESALWFNPEDKETIMNYISQL